MTKKYNLVYTESTLQDISDIGLFIGQDNKDRAITFCNELFTVVKQLEVFPYIGVMPKYIEYKIANIRMLLYKKYLIFYVIKEKKNEVIILRIINAALNYKYIF